MTAASADDAINALPPGTRFGELEILGTLGVGGFGIVYLARDHSLEREIAIKEYMPSQFAQRDGRSQVSVRSVSMHETFELGRRSFVNEAKLLARFDHPSLLKVYRFWEANGTAYMAMPRLVGQNLREARKGRPIPPSEAWVRRIFDSVLGGLETLHSQHVWHRDVAPDNIFMPADGSPPILLDFGAARQAISDRTQVFTAILKPSFAPIEQYAEATSLKQGPWTDLYALAAAMHELLTGRPPPPATARAMGDELAPLDVPGYSSAFLAGLDWALRVAPHQRPQSVAAWREVLDGRAPVPAPQPAPPRTVAPPASPTVPGALDLEFADTVQGPPPGDDDDDGATVVVPLRKPPPPPPPPPPPTAPPPSPPSAAPPPLPARAAGPAPVAQVPQSRAWHKPAMIGGAVLALLLLVFFVLNLRERMARLAVPPLEPDAPAASAPALPASLPVPAASEPHEVSSPSPVQPASQPASAPVVAERPAAPAVLRPQPAPASSAVRPNLPASAAARRPDGALKPVITEKPGDVRPVPRSPVVAAPEPDAAAKAAASAATPPAAAAPAEPRTASEACGKRVLLARAWCIDRQCEKPQFRNDPECVRLRELRRRPGDQTP